ncbi:MAG TPA: nitroreductase family protein [Thermoplasmatales archaeon]|nr:nitroreductase family protein [Thermoplasmatales archaeon]
MMKQSEIVINAIKNRRSIRSFEEKKVDKEVIEEIIQAGRYAPSAQNRQPWRFIVITNKKMINELFLLIKKEIKKLLKHRFIKSFSIKELREEDTVKFLYAVAFSEKDVIFYNAPVLIFILTENRLFNDESCACCAENMMLAAHAMGLGSCWIGFASILGLNKETKERIGIPEGYHISAALVFGYPKVKKQRITPRKSGADILKWFD